VKHFAAAERLIEAGGGSIMPIARYGVLKGRALAGKLAGSKPHYQVLLNADGASHRIAINVMSAEKPSELLYVVNDDFSHPLLANLDALAEGFTAIDSHPGGLALDFVRVGGLFERTDLRVLPADRPGENNDLKDLFDLRIRQAIDRPEARIYAYGAKWGPEDAADQYFGFRPGNGIHDIHMNQGNSAGFSSDDGVYQDGALLIHYPAQSRWTAVFLVFQSQSFVTDDATGHTISVPPDQTAAASLRIIAALVNPAGDEVGHETVTLLNPTPAPVDLAGWKLVDRLDKRDTLTGTIPAGETLRWKLTGQGAQLSNKGGTIALLNPSGQRVGGVSFTGEQAKEGWTVVF
jgi:uncharacterized protein YukJ